MKQYRQGDVFIEQIAELPKDLKPQTGKIVLAYGETTGHAHVIEDECAESFVDVDGNLFISTEEPVTVKHEEHSDIALPPGIYKITHQREYTPEEVRRVQD
jgi:hypothetical protein